MSYGLHLSDSGTIFGRIFRKKNFGRKKIFWTPLTEKTGKKMSKMAKNGIFEVLKTN